MCASLQDEPELGADGCMSKYMGVHGVVSVLVWGDQIWGVGRQSMWRWVVDSISHKKLGIAGDFWKIRGCYSFPVLSAWETALELQLVVCYHVPWKDKWLVPWASQGLLYVFQVQLLWKKGMHWKRRKICKWCTEGARMCTSQVHAAEERELFCMRYRKAIKSRNCL